ncbi:hypothetical protein E3N88_02092 [Mikania micrantha]|uniref:AAA+ ATPase domain-containing protein n=1 Tax=Mikania micrantha TaxID=192012 RepID=A0A5N6Q4H6_9ASTR|nr:hypothetical protein E3N88_02092 [Mikania micrantha]
MDCISFITLVVGYFMAPVKKHLGFFVSSTKYVTDMKEKMTQLSLTEQDIRHKWEEAIARNHEVSHHVLPWLEEVKKMNQKTQSIPTDGIEFFNMAKRHKVGKQSYNILEEIQDLETRGSMIVFTNKQKPLAEVVSNPTRPSTSGTQNNDFESRDLTRKAALKSLQSINNQSHKMIALCGMGGVGKTTMMEHIKKDVEDSKMFDRVVKVVLGENVETIALQRAIAKYNDLEDLKEDTEDARADRLRRKFEGVSQQGQKVLVILDDLWKVFDLKDVGLSPLPNGFKLLFTSRDRRICTNMGVRNESIFDVGFLNYEEAKTLFFRVVGISDGDDPSLKRIGEDIVKRCGGLPFAIVTIAKSLTDNIQEAWKKALWRLEEDDLKDLEGITHRIFEMSYENLKDDNDRAIFLLSGLFPDDFDIRIEDLLRYGWGLDFFKDAKTLSMARGDTKISVNDLLRANLLTKSDKVGCVMMHDLVRAFVLNKVSDVKQASFMNYHDDNNSDRYSCKRILLKCTNMTEFPVGFTSYPNLSMLMLMDGNEHLKFPQDIYKRMEKLEVVSYENMYVPSSLLTFQHSITKLRTLSLRSCWFINDDISLIGSLSNLETLTLVDCRISRLPRVIGKLKRMKLLDLTGCVDLLIDDGFFENLAGLEELYMKPYHDSPIRFTKVNYEELEILSHCLFALEVEFFENKVKPKNMSFKNLERFKISIGCHLAELKDGQEMESFCDNVIELPEMVELILGGLPKFTSIYPHFHNTSEMQSLLNKKVAIPRLEKLYVSRMENLKHIWPRETVDENINASMLRFITVEECKNLRNLFPLNPLPLLEHLRMMSVVKMIRLKYLFSPLMVKYLTNLKSLFIYVCAGIEEIISSRDDAADANEEENVASFLFPQLNVLELSCLSCLRSFDDAGDTIHHQSQLSGEALINACRLSLCKYPKTISVNRCDAISVLIPWYAVGKMKRLEELKIKYCETITKVFDEGSESGTTLTTPTLLLKTTNHVLHVPQLSNLKHVKIRKCDLLSHVFTFSTLESLKQLKFLSVINCNAIQETVKQEIHETTSSKDDHVVVFPRLTALQLEELPNLKGFFLGKNNLVQLKDLHISGCEKIEVTVKEQEESEAKMTMLPRLKSLKLYNLESFKGFCLDLTECVDLLIDDGLFENLVGLKELYMRPYYSPIKFTKVNCEELEILSHCLFALEVELFGNKVKPKNISFKNLERFKISIGCKLEVLKDGQGNALAKTIQLVGECNELSQCKISEIFNKTEGFHLQVNEMNQLEDILTQHQEPFSNLTVLHVSKCANLTCLFTVDVASGLKKLERLKISDCPVMRTLVAVEYGMEGVVRLQKLNFMSLTGLPELESFCDNVIELPEMVELILGDLPKFISIYPHVHNTSEMQSLLNKKVAIPRLEKLYVSRMENLKYIWPRETVDENINASMLRFISVKECKNLRNLFPLNPLPLLKHLEELVVKECHSIEVLFNMELESNNNYKSKLRSIEVRKLGSLKELWRMINVGHVLNKSDVQIKCFNGVESIKISNCEMFTNIFTPATCNFDLGALTEIITKYVGGEDDQTNASISRGREISEMDEDIINACTYTWATCHHLQKLELRNDKRVKEVLFEMDSTHQQYLPYGLEFLFLGGLHEMSHVWKCNNWKKNLIPQRQPATLQLQLPFQNLTNISLDYCHRLKYLFSPIMVKYLSNLKSLFIHRCDGIEEIISSRDDAADANEEENVASSTSSHQISTTFLFPQLNVLSLQDLPCLRSFDDAGDTIHHQSQLSGEALINACRLSLCQYPKKITISSCGAISVVIPWYIWNCKTVTKLFDEGSESGTTLTTPTVLLKTTNHVLHVPQLYNLKHVEISGCDLLSHVFTFSTLESLKQLKLLSVTNCNAIQEIVKQEINETTSSKDDHVVVFPRLTTLKLENLRNLKGFFLGKNKFRWPSLDTLIINDCPQLMTFTYGVSETPKLNYISTRFGKYGLDDCGLSFHGKINEYTQTTFPASSSYVTDSKGTTFSFHNLIEIEISRQDVETLIPSNVLLQLQKLEKICITICDKLKEIEVIVKEQEESEAKMTMLPRLKSLELSKLGSFKGFCLGKENFSLPLLDSLQIVGCPVITKEFTKFKTGGWNQLWRRLPYQTLLWNRLWRRGAATAVTAVVEEVEAAVKGVETGALLWR